MTALDLNWIEHRLMVAREVWDQMPNPGSIDRMRIVRDGEELLAEVKRLRRLCAPSDEHQPLRVILESPYAGKTPAEIDRNVRYLRRAMRHSLLLGEAPFASHGLYTLPGVLRDELPHERRIGMTAGFAWAPVAEAVIALKDHGISPGAEEGLRRHEQRGLKVIEREIGKEPL